MSKEETGISRLTDRVELSRGQALDRVVNGEIIVNVQGGKSIWVDKFERERVG